MPDRVLPDGKPKHWTHSGTGRCRNTETRYVPKDAHTKIRTVPRLVRCTEPAGHEGDCRWFGLAFGAAQPGRR